MIVREEPSYMAKVFVSVALSLSLISGSMGQGGRTRPNFYRFLVGFASVVDCNTELQVEINPFLPKLLLVMVFYHSNRN